MAAKTKKEPKVLRPVVDCQYNGALAEVYEDGEICVSGKFGVIHTYVYRGRQYVQIVSAKDNYTTLAL